MLLIYIAPPERCLFDKIQQCLTSWEGQEAWAGIDVEAGEGI